MQFEKVSRRDMFLEWWPRVRQGLVANVEHHGEIAAPERVYQSLVAGTADLYLLFDAEDYLGFVVLTVEGVGLREHPYLYLWQAFTPGLRTGDRIRRYVDGLDHLACERGLTRIRMNTTRKGWARAVREFAEPVTVEYERKVPHG